MDRDYTKVPNQIAKDARLSMTARHLYTLLRMHDYEQKGQKKGFVWPSQKTLSEYTGLSVRMLQRYIAELEAVGLIKTIRPDMHTSNRYLIYDGVGGSWNNEEIIPDDIDVAS